MLLVVATEGIPQDVAFIAMAHQQLGQPTEAGAAFERLTALMGSDVWKDNTEAREFYNEARQLQQGGR